MGHGRNIRSKDIRGRIQLVFQEPAESLDPRIRVGETLGEPLRYLGQSRADRDARVRDVVMRLGLTERVLDQYPLELSAGQQQRVGIGRAIVTRPQLIVLDEPTSALDPTARAEIVDLLIRLQRELGTAYLFISHDLSTVRFLSHRVAVLYLGKIVEQAESEELFARPLHPYSAGLLASVLLPDPALKRTRAITLAGEIPSPIDLPTGCSLAGRCPLADAQCRLTSPPAVAVQPKHHVRCYHHDRVAAIDQTVDHFARFQADSKKLLSVGAS
jgi:oligopeptide/dipeptide ABC transporter ATP-binding protein